jgi:hypothetical protein
VIAIVVVVVVVVVIAIVVVVVVVVVIAIVVVGEFPLLQPQTLSHFAARVRIYHYSKHSLT